MRQLQTFTAIIEQEDDGFVALCPQLDIASQGDTVQEAKNNLTEAIELFLEVADLSEIQSRFDYAWSVGLKLRRRNELVTTKTELNAMAAAAKMGLSSQPKKG